MRRNKKTRGFFAKHTGQAAASKTFAKQMMEMPTNPDPVWKAALLFQGELDHIDDAMGHTVDSVSDELTMKRPTNDAMFGLLEQFISLYGYFDQFYEAFQAGNGVTPPVETSQNAVSLGYPLDITYWNDALNASGGQPVNVEGNTAEDAYESLWYFPNYSIDPGVYAGATQIAQATYQYQYTVVAPGETTIISA